MLAPSPTLTAAEFADDLRVVGLLDGKRIGTANDLHGCARATVLLLAADVGETIKFNQRAVIRKLHYGGRHDETQKKITGETPGLPQEVRRRGGELMKWICDDPERKARALARIREAQSAS